MDYQRIYSQIIDRAEIRKLQGYRERHHIVPKCMGGSDKKDNLVELTAREHFICHWILCRIYPKNPKLVFAFVMMCQMKSRTQERYLPSSRAYGEAKELNAEIRGSIVSPIRGIKRPWLSNQNSERIGQLNPMYGRGIERLGKLNPNYGNVGKLNSKSKPVEQIDSDTGEVVGRFANAVEAAKYTGLQQVNINNCCLNKKYYKTAGGYKWKYTEEYLT